MKSFVFLYPIPEIIDSEIKHGSYGFLERNRYEDFSRRIEKAGSWEEKEKIKHKFLKECELSFRKTYKEKINVCIDLRYRKKGFEINYAIFDGHEISNVINLQTSDRIIEVGMDFKTHTTKQPDGTYPYPDNDFILNQLGNIQTLRVAGFHMWDCVGKLAGRAYERGLETLVDEDLTEFFTFLIKDGNLQIDKFPSYNPIKHGKSMFNDFMEARKGKPWLWQEY